jgi:hypothetical protein
VVAVLRHAAAAAAKVRALWRNANRALAFDRGQLREFVVRLLAIRRVFDDLARQRAVDKNRLALVMRHTAPFLIERLHKNGRVEQSRCLQSY